jgi:ATP-dependent RNA helicase MSS116, mitochondrial
MLRAFARPLSVARGSQHRQSAILKPTVISLRGYATEATAAAVQDVDTRDAPVAASGRPRRFVELLDLGIHESLVRSITNGMRYETMSDVQSMTVVPAMHGKDV